MRLSTVLEVAGHRSYDGALIARFLKRTVGGARQCVTSGGQVMKRKVLVCLLLGALIIILVGVKSDVWAQSGTTGALTGSVGNSTGDPLPAATVTLRNQATGQAQTVAT